MRMRDRLMLLVKALPGQSDGNEQEGGQKDRGCWEDSQRGGLVVASEGRQR